MPARKLKFALMAATALAASGGVAAHAAAAAPSAAPMETVAIVHAADEAAQKPMPAAQKLTLAAFATAALAALAHLIGLKRLRAALAATAPAAAKAARLVAAPVTAAARAVGRAASSPLRFLMVMAGLGVFAMTGVSLFDIEWAGGLVVGAGLVALTWLGAQRLPKVFARKAQAPTRARSAQKISNP